MPNRHSLILKFLFVVLFIVIGIYVYYLKDRFGLYVLNQNHPPKPLAVYQTGQDVRKEPNVDLGFISFYLELSPEAEITAGNGCLKIKDLDKRLMINWPIVAGEEPAASDPEVAKQEQAIAEAGSLVHFNRDVATQNIDASIFFCTSTEYDRKKLLVEARVMQSLVSMGGSQSFYIGKTFDAIVTEYPDIHLSDIHWATKQTKAPDQRQSGVINLFGKKDKSTVWKMQFVQSLVVRPPAGLLSGAEMKSRVEKAKRSVVH
jgi:hypothetical protein